MILFQKRKQVVNEIVEKDDKQRTEGMKMMEGVFSNPTLSPEHQSLFAETLREVSYCRC